MKVNAKATKAPLIRDLPKAEAGTGVVIMRLYHFALYLFIQVVRIYPEVFSSSSRALLCSGGTYSLLSCPLLSYHVCVERSQKSLSHYYCGTGSNVPFAPPFFQEVFKKHLTNLPTSAPSSAGVFRQLRRQPLRIRCHILKVLPLRDIIIILASKEINQLERRVCFYIRIRLPQKIHPFSLSDFFEVEPGGAQGGEEGGCPVEGVWVDDVVECLCGGGEGYGYAC